MQINDIMTKKVISVRADTKVMEVSQILFKGGIHGVPVVDAENHLIGIITESDFFVKDVPQLYLPSYIDFLKRAEFVDSIGKDQKKNAQKLVEATAEDIMTSDCVVAYADTKVEELISIFKEKHLYTLPIIDKEKKVIGVVTMADIIKLLK